jgi:hypothetical protein
VEGPDDEQFFQRVVQSRLEQAYQAVQILTCAHLTPRKINQMVNSFKAMGADYVFVSDNDRAPCITARKQKIKAKWPHVDSSNVIVVVEEIEGWYLAGLSQAASIALKFQHPGSTDRLTKEAFRLLQPKQFAFRLSFMLELLKHFSVETAQQNNKSFAYFARKYLA